MASVSSQRTERLLNLVIALLWTRTWLTKEQLRSAVPQYADSPSPEAFERMFERDKDDLRELGIPILTGSHETFFDEDTTTLGYRIDRSAYELPALDFTSEEATVLGLASRVWQQASLAGPAARALTKLRALGVEPDQESLVGLEPRVRTAEPAFGPLYKAVLERAPVAFSYRKPSGASRAKPMVRHLEPWGLLTWRGRWYVSGYDQDRESPRVFRLSRIEGSVKRIGPVGAYEIPEDFDARAALAGDSAGQEEFVATVWLKPGAGHSLRMRIVDEPASGVPGAPAARPAPPDGEIHSLRYTDTRAFAAELASYGPDVRVEGPPELRAAVIDHLRRVEASVGETSEAG